LRDEEEGNKPEESQQPTTSGYPEVFLNLTLLNHTRSDRKNIVTLSEI
jgi:hypothetical protein